MFQSGMPNAIFIAFVLHFVTAPTHAALPRHQHFLSADMNAEVAPLTSSYSIVPKHPVIPFKQWESNLGYCGETSFLQAGLNQGMWMSQWNARLLCGTGLGQSGGVNFCSAHGDANYNAQFLIENPNPGDAPFASAGLCLQNAHLAYQLYDYANAPAGMAGYQRYLSWVKAQVIAGNQVTIGVLNQGGNDSQYDHEVSVTKIGTNHSPTDSAYYGDDVLYFDDHGNGGTPYTQGYSFDSLANTREGANSFTAHSYSILIPGVPNVLSGAGGNGVDLNPHAVTAQNVAFSVSGIIDSAHVTLPTTVTIVGTSVHGTANSPDSTDGFNFENPELQSDCTESPPSSWMGMSLRADVAGLTPGQTYNLYEYDFAVVSGFGAAASLKLPEANFNANAGMATKVTHFVAPATTYSQTIQTTSDQVVVFRVVGAQAP
jgi:hypothetical protein